MRSILYHKGVCDYCENEGESENVKLSAYINDHLRMNRKQLRDQRFSIIKLL